MAEVLIECITAIIVAIILAGGLNRAAFYISGAIIAYLANKDKKDGPE